MIRLVLLFALISPAAAAQGVRDTDARLTASEIEAKLAGRVLEFFDGSKARYRADGGYAYTYTDEGPPFQGTYSARDEGEVCVVFDNGFDRCDTYVLSGDRLVLIIADGTRFPVRSVTPLSE
ncbi:MAG: hypothetical protein AAGA87_02225 [Pseudomonadota bacterium]